MRIRLLFAILVSSLWFTVQASESQPAGPRLPKPITVYKSPTCGCCAGWAEYLEDNGFQVSIVDRHDLSDLKSRHGITPALRSCHTAIVDGYAIEGHVPANDIWRLLKEKPVAAGLTAPGMPSMSPGMNSIEPSGYDVLLYDKSGHTQVYSRY